MSSLIPQVTESELPADEQRIRLPAQALVDSGAVEHTAGPTWRQQMEIGVLLIVAPPGVIAAAYLVSRIWIAAASWVGATFLAN